MQVWAHGGPQEASDCCRVRSELGQRDFWSGWVRAVIRNCVGNGVERKRGQEKSARDLQKQPASSDQHTLSKAAEKFKKCLGGKIRRPP